MSIDEEARGSQTVKALLGLRELVFSGALRPGERISELAMVDRLGVSRTPVRLALVRLEEEGLVEASPNGGFVVRAFTTGDIVDAIELRGVLEGTAARFAAERGPDRGELAALRDCVGALDALINRRVLAVEDFGDYLRLNERFHALLVDLAASPVLRRQIERIYALPFAGPSAFVTKQAELPESREILVIAQEQHRSIAEAIEAREGARAEALAREHSRVARRNLDIVFADRETFADMPGGALVRAGGRR
jgi:GntR family transcriptional regulator of vanillate catabolism